MALIRLQNHDVCSFERICVLNAQTHKFCRFKVHTFHILFSRSREYDFT